METGEEKAHLEMGGSHRQNSLRPQDTDLAGTTFWYGYDGLLDNKRMTMMQGMEQSGRPVTPI
jgi:hypothetical protein